MNSRIIHITDILNTSNRFCVKERENIDYITSMGDIEYDLPNIKFETLKEESTAFLLNALSE